MSDKHEYPKPSLTADVVVFTMGERTLRCLFIRRGHAPFQGSWALPGGFCEPTESVDQAAARELQEETRLAGVALEPIGAFTRPGRDPRGWVISVAHLAIVSPDRMREAKAGDDAADARWLDVVTAGGGLRLEHEGKPAGALAFDHDEVMQAAVARLRERITTHAFRFLPARFSRREVQRVFEAILGRRIDAERLEAELVDREMIEHVDGQLAPTTPPALTWG